MERLIDKSSFSLHSDCAKEIYYNPDSDSGGQLVVNSYSKEQIVKAFRSSGTDEEFWDQLDNKAKQVLIDCDDDDFSLVLESVGSLHERSGQMMRFLYCWAKDDGHDKKS